MPHATQILKRERDESPEPSTSKRRRHDADTTPSIPAAEDRRSTRIAGRSPSSTGTRKIAKRSWSKRRDLVEPETVNEVVEPDVTAGTQLAAPTVEVAVASPASAAIDSRLEFCIASPIMTPSSGTHTCAEVVTVDDTLATAVLDSDTHAPTFDELADSKSVTVLPIAATSARKRTHEGVERGSIQPAT